MAHFDVDFELKQDGRWIAEIESVPGVLVYGTSRDEAQTKAEALAEQVLLAKSSEM
jgi:predicted RNase H-like HicB family nuclease